MQTRSSESNTNNFDRVALVTGSSSGIGANIAVDLTAEAYHVIVTGRDLRSLLDVAEGCKSGSVSTFVADLYDMKQVESLVEYVRIKFNRLDVLVNNACWRGSDEGILSETDEFEKVLHMNLTVPMYLIHKCLIPLKPKDTTAKAVVINISSIASQVAVPLHFYSISKACLSEMSKQIGLISRELGIYSITVSPGPILTDERPHHKNMRNQTLLDRVGSTQDIANLVIHTIANPHLFNARDLFIDGGVAASGVQRIRK